MIRKSTFLSLLFLSYISGFAQNAVDYINPIIGATTDQAQGEGKTFPGAATPLGLVQLSPDTITGGDNGSGYSYTHSSIQGFSFTHMSGVGWYGDLGNFEVMPTCGDLKTSSGSPTLSVSPVDGIYMIGSPLFNKAIIHMPNSDKIFTIIANNQSQKNLYIQSALLNRHSLNRCYLTHKEITQGGILMFEMGPVPNKNWGLNN